MDGRSRLSPELFALSNGDSSSDDDVFMNSRLDVMTGNYPSYMHHTHNLPNTFQSLLDNKNFNKMEFKSPLKESSPSPRREQNAVIFSVTFCGKNFGEVGLFEPDISILNWCGFKSYLFSSLNLELSDSFIICYCDEEGDKIPIETEEEYQEALKIAKQKASEEEKFQVYITRIGSGGSFPNSLRSLVSSSLRRVNSVGSTKSATVSHTLKKDVTTSTSFLNLEKETLNSFDLGIESSLNYLVPFGNITLNSEVPYSKGQEMAAEQQVVVPRGTNAFFLPAGTPFTIGAAHPAEVGTPSWFSDYMNQFKEDLCQAVSSKIEELFDYSVGHLRTTEVEKSVKSLLTVYSSEMQNKVLCCCKTSTGVCSKAHLDGSSVTNKGQVDHEAAAVIENEHNLDIQGSVESQDSREHDVFQQLLKKEKDILDFIDKTNEKIKRKIELNNELNNSLRKSNDDFDFGTADRERVLNRIADVRQRQSRTADDFERIRAANLARSLGFSKEDPSINLYDAKFISDRTLPDGTQVESGQLLTKTWVVQNSGSRPWDERTSLRCITKDAVQPQENVQCPTLLPGEKGNMSVSFTAPLSLGEYHTQWRFVQNDLHFGDHLWCSVDVIHRFISREERNASDCTSILREHTTASNNSISEQLLTVAAPENLLLNDSTANFKENVRLYSDLNELYVSSMDTEQLLNFILYIMHLSKKNLVPLKNSEPYGILRDLLLEGIDKHSNHLTKYLENHVRGNQAEIRHSMNNTVRGFCELVFQKSGAEEAFEGGVSNSQNDRQMTEEGNACGNICHELFQDFIQDFRRGYFNETHQQNTCCRTHTHSNNCKVGVELQSEDVDCEYVEEEEEETDEECDHDCAEEHGDSEYAEEQECEGEYVEDEPEEIEDSENEGEGSECPGERQGAVHKVEDCEYAGDETEETEVSENEDEGSEHAGDEEEECQDALHDVENCVNAADQLKELEDSENEGERSEFEGDLLEECQDAVPKVEDNEYAGDELEEIEDLENEAEGSEHVGDEEQECQDALHDVENCVNAADQLKELEDSENEGEGSEFEGDLLGGQDVLHQVEDFEYAGDERKGMEEKVSHSKNISLEIVGEGICHEKNEEKYPVMSFEEKPTPVENLGLGLQSTCERFEIDMDNNSASHHLENELEATINKIAEASIDEELYEENGCDLEENRTTALEENESKPHVADITSEESDYSLYSDSDSEFTDSDGESNSEIMGDGNAKVISNFENGLPSMEPHPQEGKENLVVAAQSTQRDSMVKDVKKEISCLHQNFNQNVEVNLDFEVISHRPVQDISQVAAKSQATSDPLTFQEKHFMISSRGPPQEVVVQDSDEESFDGLVYVNHEDIPTSGPATEPCSPSTEGAQQPFREVHFLESDLSQSCSSFSECEDEDERNEEDDGGGGAERPGVISSSGFQCTTWGRKFLPNLF